MPSVPGYVYAQNKDKIYINLFVQSTTNIEVKGNKVAVSQTTNYPWEGDVEIAVSPDEESSFTVCLRVPGWAVNQPVPSDLYKYEDTDNDPVIIRVNGEAAGYRIEKGYAQIDRGWKKGDVIAYELPMNIRRVKASRQVKDDLGKVALERGPIVYCTEGADNTDIDKVTLTKKTLFDSSFDADLLEGVEVITAQGSDGEALKAIPYYAWNNRGASKMKVWLPETP